MVTWGIRFPCLDNSFDVLISRIGNLGLYNWFFHIYFTCCLITCSCMPVLTTWFSIHALAWIYRYMYVYPCTPLDTHLTHSLGSFWLPWICVSILGAWTVMNFLVNRVVHRQHRGVAADRPGPYLFSPLTHLLSFSFIIRERLLYCS